MTPEQLRASILQQAMEGKLVKQDFNDISAINNLENARKELTTAMNNKKMRKEKYSYADTPSTYPKNWRAARLIELCKKKNGSIRRGPFGSAITKSMFVKKGTDTFKIYEQGNAINHTVQYGTYYMPNSEFSRLKSFEVHAGDIIISCAGTIGKTYILPDNMEKGIINQALMKLEIDESIIDKHFFLLAFKNVTKQLQENAKGSAIKNLASLKYLKNKVTFPLPPLAEQKRIVARLDQLMPLVDEYAEAYDKLKKLDDGFNDKLKQSLLQYAMEGKLVKQDPNDEPASVLLEKIAEEKARLIKEKKIKRTKKLPAITDDEKPFDIPDSWEWVKLGEIGNYIQRGRSPKYDKVNHNHPIISQKCIQWSGITLQDAKFITQEFFEKLENYRFVQKNDILWNSTGTGTVGRANVVREAFEKVPVDSHVTLIRVNRNVDPQFIYYYLISPIIQNNLDEYLTGTTKQKELGLNSILNVVLPIPPINEQKRIVAKLDQLMSTIH